MKHPLTSKERRGLTAVAAAALLCIGSGFIFRNCAAPREAPLHPKGGVVVVDGSAGDSISENSEGSEKSDGANGKRSRREKRQKGEKKNTGKKKSEKTYPTRSPLDEPI